MMQEDNNGDSTFEFIDKKLENLQLNADGTILDQSQGPPMSTNPSTGPPLASNAPPITPYFTPSTGSQGAPGNLPPPPVTSYFTPIVTAAPNVTQQPPNVLPPFQPNAPIPYPIANTSLVSSPYAQGRVSTSSAAPNLAVYPTAPPPPVSQYAFSGAESHNVQSAQPGRLFNPGYPQQNMTLEMPSAVDIESPYYGKPMSSPTGDGSGGLIGWLKDTVTSSDFLSKVAEKAKNSVDTMITTLDPQMKEYMKSGGEIDLIVVSENEEELSAIRDSFQTIFGRATVRGQSAPIQFAPQLIGFNSALGSGDARIKYLRTGGIIDPQQPAISIESFVAELHADEWYEMTALVLRDPYRNLSLQSFTSPISIENAFIYEAKNLSSDRYELSWSGLQVSIGDLVSRSYGIHDWKYALSGTPLKDRISLAARCLAINYKRYINQSPQSQVLHS